MEYPVLPKHHLHKSILRVMTILKDFKVKKADIDSSEADSKHTFDMAQQSRLNQLKSFEDQVARMEEIISGKEEEKNKAENDKASTEEDKTADETFLDELVKECEE